MRLRKAFSATDAAVALIVLAAIVVGAVTVLRMDVFGQRDEEPQDGGQEEPVPAPIDPAMIKYRQTAAIGVPFDEPRALAVGAEDRIYAGGDRAIVVFAPDGSRQTQIDLDHEPRCLAVADGESASPGAIYAGTKDRVVQLHLDGTVASVWPDLGPHALITSIAATEEDVFVADAGNRIVLRYDTSGNLVNRIGQRDPKRNVPGFAITSEYFDLAVSPDGLLRVVNPRALRIEAYTFEGDLESHFGRGGAGLEAFFGCCNPAHFAALRDGRFVTAEKGVARVKIYGVEGKLECVVAGPEELQLRATDVIADLAVDGRGRVLVLDPRAKQIRIFEPKETGPEGP